MNDEIIAWFFFFFIRYILEEKKIEVGIVRKLMN